MIKTLRSIILCAIAICLCLNACQAFDARTGTTGAQAFKIPAGVRPMGMGEAFCAIANDVNSIYWNPAGLSKIQNRELNLSYNSWLNDISYGYFAYAQPVEKIGSFGASVNYVYLGNFIGRDNIGGKIDDFTGYDLLLNISYAKNVVKNTSLGVNLKFMQEKIENESALTWAMDLGALYEVSPVLTAGLCIQNISSGISFTAATIPDPLTLNIKLGCGYKLNEKLLLGLDVNIPNDNLVNVHIGMEYMLTEALALRAGYKTNRINDMGPLSGLCAGIGFRQSNYSIDFAYSPLGEVGNGYRVSLGLFF